MSTYKSQVGVTQFPSLNFFIIGQTKYNDEDNNNKQKQLLMATHIIIILKE